MTPSRYPSIAWPWVGVLLCAALLGQEYLLQVTGPNAPLTAYRLTLMTVGVTSVALVLLPPRRIGYVLGFLICLGLLGWAYYLQYGLDLEPCPLCIIQRVCFAGMGLVFLVAIFHNPGRAGAAVYAVLQLLIGGFGAAVALRQVWIQSLSKGEVPSCGMSLDYMLETLPLTETIRKVFEGSGECAEKAWVFLHLSVAGWALVIFIAMIVASFALIRRD
ncbi:MAG TPA: disulfide bond formation protein B [Casimicrobiaceae bacterium]|jgi:disulfide bond formation protein DsbB|nr:disulfide bond formation protein B [Casimicrobiaceae bacterium]